MRTMYGMRKMAVILVAFLALVAFTGCEPVVNITARVSAAKPACRQVIAISGKIDQRDTTTTSLWLQYRSDGRWIDWTWTPGDPVNVAADDTYKLTFQTPWWTTDPIAIRVRSQDRLAASPAVYITPTAYTPGICA